MANVVGSASKNVLIEDLKSLSKRFPGSITRNFYRAQSNFAESNWQRFFPTFSSFLFAAGIQPKEKPTPPETDEINGDLRSISVPKTNIRTLEELLEHCKVDLSVWKVEHFLVNTWEMSATTGDEGKKKFITQPLFQVKATLRRRPEIVEARKEIDKLKEEAKRSARVPTSIIHPVRNSGNVLEINIPDAHFGKLAWSKETDGPNYDTTIAQQTFVRALDTLLERVKGYTFDEVLFVVGNDLLNSDDLEGRTTKGTFVSTDGRYQKTFGVVRRTITQCIERLRKIAPVTVAMVSGNHDDLSVWHLGDSLECYFVNYDDVTIDNAPTARKYYKFGQVMLMLTHGDKGKRTDYPLLMATERPAMFGTTKFREAHTGHTHLTKVDEQHGVRVRVLPALCPADAWHAENGFVGNLRSAEGYIWNKELGLIAQVFHNEDALSPIVTKVVTL